MGLSSTKTIKENEDEMDEERNTESWVCLLQNYVCSLGSGGGNGSGGSATGSC